MGDEPLSPLASEIARLIRLADATSLAGSLGKLLMGVGVCLMVGVFVATFICTILWRLFDHTVLSWSAWFWLYVLVLIPLIIWYERKFREDYVGEALGSIDPKPSSYGEYRLNETTMFAGYASWAMLIGPRNLVDGFRGIMGRRSMLQNAVLGRAVRLVLDLLRAPGRVEIKQLIIPPENMRILTLSIDMLDSNDMIGKAADGAAVWLTSAFRDKLQRFQQSQH
jgi:hypothetical protein